MSVLVPVYRPDPSHLDALAASLLAQSHPDWELCLGLDGPQPAAVTEQVGELVRAERRIRCVTGDARRGISAATRLAAGLARGAVVTLADQDDLLDPGACAALATAFDADPELELVTTDEDCLTAWGLREAPTFRPGPSPFLALGTNYAMHLLAFRRALWDRLGGPSSELDGAQDHDLLLRGLEQARRSRHLPLVAYTWRRSRDSVAGGSGAKPWAYEAGRRAVEAACRRRGLPVREVRHAAVSGVYAWRPERPALPLPCHVVATEGDGAARAGLAVRLGREPGLDVRGHHDEWPAPGEGEALLLVDAARPPGPEELDTLVRHAALPGVGAVATTPVRDAARAHLGYSVSARGVAHPIPDHGLAAAVPHEVATSLGGAVWIGASAARHVRPLAGRIPSLADLLCLPLAAWAEGETVLLLPAPDGAVSRHDCDRAPVHDLTASPLWSRLHPLLRAGLLRGGADPFCPRHPLLVPAGYPPPVA